MERRALRTSGFLMLPALLVLIWCDFRLLGGSRPGAALSVAALVFVNLALLAVLTGFTILGPNEARVVQFFGRYVGSVRSAGFHWTVPLSTKRLVSLRVSNFESAVLKVSDADGNPVEIAAVVVWAVIDSARAAFAVNDYTRYVAVQAEAAVRHMATAHPYDAHESGRISLRDSAEISAELTEELRQRVALAGVDVLESRITHLAYAPEIAQAMLARQQASAIVAARTQIVEGAVGMVHMALDRLREEQVVHLDEERKAQMVANLLVVLVGDRAIQPVVNSGTLYG